MSTIDLNVYRPPKLDKLTDASLKENYCCTRASVSTCMECRVCVYGKELLRRARTPETGKKAMPVAEVIAWLKAIADKDGCTLVRHDGNEIFAGKALLTAVMYLENMEKGQNYEKQKA